MTHKLFHHDDCNTRKESGCFYPSCISCDFYSTKDKKGKIIKYSWDKRKKTHVEILEKLGRK